MVGKDFSQEPNFQRAMQEGKGSFSAASSLDGKERLFTFSRVTDLPLMVVVALPTEEVFASWLRTALVVGAATGVLCLGILWLTLLLGRELRRRQDAEQGLATLAATDSLTNLPNRRRLDQVLRQEWARAKRNARPLSVLMVDVDRFKAFNERHGHQGGDQALRRVAATIQRCIRRPADLAARYGGEEFLIILPETDRQGAHQLAENLRRQIEMQPPYANDVQPVTVSIGVATHAPDCPQHSLDALLRAADEALYQAKHNGRNQVV